MGKSASSRIASLQRERASQLQAGLAVRQAFFGERDAARQSAIAALKMSNDRDVLYGVALAFALAGDFSRATGMTNDLEKRLPENTAVRFSYMPTASCRSRGESWRRFKGRRSAASCRFT
jgi:hypothetical protein